MGRCIKYAFIGLINIVLCLITLICAVISCSCFYIASIGIDLGLLIVIGLYIISVIFAVLFFLMAILIGAFIKNAF